MTQHETMPSTKRTTTAANDYRSFLRALKKGKYTIDQLDPRPREDERPEKLQALIELIGEKRYEEYLTRALNNGHIDQETGEVLWVEHKKNPVPSPENDEPKLAGTGSEVLPPPPAPPVAKTPEQVQKLVDEAVEKNGANILDRSDCDEILHAFDLRRDEVTERMIDRANNHVQRKLREHLATENDKTRNRVKVVWEGDEELDPALNADHPIRGAAASRQDMEERDKTATRERLNGLSSKNSDNGDGKGRIINEGDHDTFTFGENEMNLSEKAARILLIAAGVEAKTWGQKKLATFLNDQERLVEATEPEDVKQKERFLSVLKAVADGKKITVTETPGENGADSKKKGKKSDKPKKEKLKPGEGRDQFGSRLGTVRSEIHKRILKKTWTAKELAVEVNYPASGIQTYLRDTLAKKHPEVVETKDGWAVKG